MGEDFKCGCRVSCGAWYLCNKHENDLIFNLEEYNKPINKLSQIINKKIQKTFTDKK